MRSDVVLRDAFRFSVPVLQWAGTFSKPTWERMSRRAPPYGWKGLPVDGNGGGPPSTNPTGAVFVLGRIVPLKTNDLNCLWRFTAAGIHRDPQPVM